MDPKLRPSLRPSKGNKRRRKRRNETTFASLENWRGDSSREIVFTVKFALSGIGLRSLLQHEQPRAAQTLSASYSLFVSRQVPPWGFIRPWATSVCYWNPLFLLSSFSSSASSISQYPRVVFISPCSSSFCYFFFFFFSFTRRSRLFPHLPAYWTQKETISFSVVPLLEVDRIRFIQFTR